jgi:predicted Rossmann fold flavoprotein
MSIAIIGGGAAGMMAAAAILEKNPQEEVFLIEKNATLGQKVLISGGGRCNVTTGFSDLRLIADRYPRGGKFLQSAFHRFGPEQVMNFFESRGVPLKVEEDLRVFPVSDNGKDIVGVFEKLLKSANLLFRTELTHLKKTASGFTLSFKNHEPITVDKVILTTGGQAYRATGSTGDGYRFAESVGHHVTTLAPSLNSFITEETWLKNLAGVSLQKAGLSVKIQKKMEWTGPILFTHRGLTGPAVFALSSLIAFEDYTRESPLELTLDFLPDTPQNLLEEEFHRTVQENPKKTYRNILGYFLPKSLASELCEQAGIDEKKQATQVGKKEQQKILEKLKHLKLHLIGRAAGDEFVTAGGVDTDEVDPRSMESKLCPGLFFAGEILNVDGFTGGYNLQAAWATGHLAGESAA